MELTLECRKKTTKKANKLILSVCQVVVVVRREKEENEAELGG